MLIKEVTATAVSVPLEIVTSMSSRTVHAREYVIVTVEDEDGSTGTGYTYAGTTGGRAVRDAVLHSLRPVLLGRPVHDIEGSWTGMYQEALLIGRRGAVLRSMSAIDIALFDLVSRKAGLPLAKFLGGWKDKVPAYASGGYYRSGDLFEQLEREIRGNQALGFTDHKIKVGGQSVREDAARVKLARELVGPDGRLALDANNVYRHAAEAIEAGRAFERAAGPLGLWWFEEPLSPEDVAGHARVAAALETAVATGEIHQTRWDFRALMEQGAAAIIQADAAVVGGISEWRRIAALCASFDVPMAPHWHHNLHVHLAACTPNCIVVEHFDLAKDVFNFERLLTPASRARPEGGCLAVPDVPGIGVEFDSRAVEQFRLK